MLVFPILTFSESSVSSSKLKLFQIFGSVIEKREPNRFGEFDSELGYSFEANIWVNILKNK